jgi:hypothetical protein
MVKSHKFHCERCDSECNIYKKGRNHRVLVCPKCGVLATNGALGKILKRGGRAVLGEVPGASLVMEGLGLASELSRKKQSSPEFSPKPSYSRALLNQHTIESEMRGN